MDGEENDSTINYQSSILSLDSQGKPEEKIPSRRVSDFRPRFYLPKTYRKLSLTDKGTGYTVKKKFRRSNSWRHRFFFYTDWANHNSHHDSLLIDQSQVFVEKPLYKSSTEVKFDRYFDESGFGKFFQRKQLLESPDVKRIDSSVTINKHDANFLATSTPTMRRRKCSTMSNLSSLDFSGSCLFLQAVRRTTWIITSNRIYLKHEKKKTVTIADRKRA